MKYQIESGVPMPINLRNVKYPFKTMEIGDSFIIDNVNAKIIHNAAYAFGKRNNKKFTVRTNDGTARIWRVQ